MDSGRGPGSWPPGPEWSVVVQKSGRGVVEFPGRHVVWVTQRGVETRQTPLAPPRLARSVLASWRDGIRT